jgi:hypothetical protein
MPSASASQCGICEGSLGKDFKHPETSTPGASAIFSQNLSGLTTQKLWLGHSIYDSFPEETVRAPGSCWAGAIHRRSTFDRFKHLRFRGIRASSCNRKSVFVFCRNAPASDETAIHDDFRWLR